MNVFLLYKARDFDPDQKPPWQWASLVRDLALDTLFGAMAKGNDLQYKIAEAVMLAGFTIDRETILYRHEILKDCLRHPAVIIRMQSIVEEALESRKNQWLDIFTRHQSAVLYGAAKLLGILGDYLRKLRVVADEYHGQFGSRGFSRFFTMLQKELTDEYLLEMETCLAALGLREEILISARLGEENRGTHYRLHQPDEPRRSWLQRILQPQSSYYAFSIHPRDEAGARALSEIQDAAMNEVAGRMVRAKDHVLGFLQRLRIELAFYLGCIELHARLTALGAPVNFPTWPATDDAAFSATGLYDPCLVLNMRTRAVENDLPPTDKPLIMITGANQGGKSTFLRSIGVAQLMMQCGMFTPATSFQAPLYASLFTHFKKEEDSTMESGKFDEELSRFSAIVDHIEHPSLLLFNESFAATNEREGSAIAGEITRALIGRGVRVCYVTHLYALAHSFHEHEKEQTLFLRAERRMDGKKTFKLLEGEPLPTSYAADTFKKLYE
ncbi:MAG TPA: hypothetical protein VHD83_08090 [Puia sp.]|nr:hypothetical protein [Puia sp.]